MKKSWLLSIVLLVPFCCELVAQAAQQEKACDDKPKLILKLDGLDEDWDISMVDRARKVGPIKPGL